MNATIASHIEACAVGGENAKDLEVGFDSDLEAEVTCRMEPPDEQSKSTSVLEIWCSAEEVEQTG